MLRNLHLLNITANALLRLKSKLSCCDLCGGQCHIQPLLCDYCLADLPTFYFDKVKGDLLNWPGINHILSQRKFDHLIALSPYAWPFDHWITQLKYQQKFELTNLLATLLARQWLSLYKQKYVAKPALVLSIPSHLSKWQHRGFNQAHLLAKEFSEICNMNYQASWLLRISNNSQVGKTGAKRRKSLKGAFKVNAEFINHLPQEVLLIDDVITTGATCNEVCKILKQHGVTNITVLSICISLPVH
jgi:ComF family protein